MTLCHDLARGTRRACQLAGATLAMWLIAACGTHEQTPPPLTGSCGDGGTCAGLTCGDGGPCECAILLGESASTLTCVDPRDPCASLHCTDPYPECLGAVTLPGQYSCGRTDYGGSSP